MDRWTEDRAVSPVIGVILMVAITVILAAVIGAFVLEIGDQQETAPNTSFDTEEELKVKTTGNDPTHFKAPQVSITHAGGDTLDISSTRFHLNGANSTWGLRNGEMTLVYPGGMNKRRVYMQPTPDVCETFGTNDQATISSGQTEYVMFGTSGEYNGNLDQPGPDYAMPTHNNISDTGVCSHFKAVRRLNAGGERQFNFASSTQDGTNFESNRENAWGYTHGPTQGSTVSVVWTASSGGKTQRLMKYEIQNKADLDGL